MFSAQFEPADSADSDAWASDLDEDLLPVTDVIANAAPEALNGGLVHDSTRVELPLLDTVTGAGKVGLGLVYASDAPGPGAYAQGRPPARGGEAIEVAVSTRTRDALKLRLGQRLPLSPGALDKVQATAVVVGFFTVDGTGTKSAGTKGGNTESAGAQGAGAAGGDRLRRELPLLAGPSRVPPRSAAGLDWEARALVAPRTVTVLQAQAGAALTVTWGMRLDLDARSAARFAGDRGRANCSGCWCATRTTHGPCSAVTSPTTAACTARSARIPPPPCRTVRIWQTCSPTSAGNGARAAS